MIASKTIAAGARRTSSGSIYLWAAPTIQGGHCTLLEADVSPRVGKPTLVGNCDINPPRLDLRRFPSHLRRRSSPQAASERLLRLRRTGHCIGNSSLRQPSGRINHSPRSLLPDQGSRKRTRRRPHGAWPSPTDSRRPPRQRPLDQTHPWQHLEPAYRQAGPRRPMRQDRDTPRRDTVDLLAVAETGGNRGLSLRTRLDNDTTAMARPFRASWLENRIPRTRVPRWHDPPTPARRPLHALQDPARQLHAWAQAEHADRSRQRRKHHRTRRGALEMGSAGSTSVAARTIPVNRRKRHPILRA